MAGVVARARTREWNSPRVKMAAAHSTNWGVLNWISITRVGPKSSSLILFKAVSMVRILVGGLGLNAGGRNILIEAFPHHVGVVGVVVIIEIINFRRFFAMVVGNRPSRRPSWHYVLLLVHGLWW